MPEKIKDNEVSKEELAKIRKKTFEEARKLLDELEADEGKTTSWLLTALYQTDHTTSTCGSASDFYQLMLASSILHDLYEDGHQSIEMPLQVIDAIIQMNMAKPTVTQPVPPKKRMH